MSTRPARTRPGSLLLRLGLRAATVALLAFVFAATGFVPLRAADGLDFHLDLDTGGHRALVKDLAFTPDGEFLVSASDDKTIRVWDWRSGVSLRTIRGQIGPGQEGKIFALDVSPDGTTIAAAGWFGPSAGDSPPYGDVRLFDLRSGRLVSVLKGNPWVVHDVAFSPDGLRLAAAGQEGFVYLWKKDEAGAWQAETRLDADSLRIEKIAFAAGGTRLAAVTADYGIRLWDLAGMSLIDIPDAAVLEDVPVRALAVSPDGSLFATGADDGRVQIWRAGDGGLAETVPQRGFAVGALAFAEAGGALVVSCGYRCAGRFEQTVWRFATGEGASHAGHDDTVWASAASPDGRLVATAGGSRKEIRVWNPATGETVAELSGLGEPVMAVGITPDGGAIAWGSEDPCPDLAACPERQSPLANVMPLPAEGRFFERPRATQEVEGFLRAVHARDGWSLVASAGDDSPVPNDVLEVRRDGATLHRIANDASSGFLHAAFTLLSDDRHLVTGGSDGTLTVYDRDTGGYVTTLEDSHSGEVHAMAEAPQAGLLVTGSDDQTLKLWNLKTRRLVATFFFAGGEFIVWVPQGYYYSSPDGDALVGWHVNQGPDSEARYVRARQLKQYLFSPEIVRRALILADAEAAVRELRGVDTELDRLLARRPPEFQARVLEGDASREGFVAVEITGAAEAGASVAQFTITANDRRIDGFETRAISGGADDLVGAGSSPLLGLLLGNASPDRFVIEVPVQPGENEISIAGLNAFGYLTERSVKAIGRMRDTDRAAGTLFVVAIGAEDYPFLPRACGGRSCNLAFPVDDAAEFLRLVDQRTRPLYREMKTLVFANADALAETKAARETSLFANVMEPESDLILDEIEDFLAEAGPDDTTIIFVAGHGINIDEDYYFIPSDGRQREPDRWQRSSLVDWETIQRAVERARGRRLMLVDTCHAGNSFNPRLEKDAEDARIIVFSATAANNTAAELPELGHGVFTHALLQGMKGGADPSGEGVRLLSLADFVDREVRRLTASRQAPEYYISKVDNFLVARP